jgi:small subunit ribosomal protein S7e
LHIETPLTISFPQIEVGHGKKAIAIFVPVPLLQGFHKIQQRYAYHQPVASQTAY